jgi:CBS domain-containing protein
VLAQGLEEEGAVMRHARIRDVMTTNVVTVGKDASYKEIATRLHEHRVSALPVLDHDRKVTGVVSAGDLLAREARPGKRSGTTAADLMTAPAVTIGPGAPVSEAARLMYARRVKRLPVVDPAGRLAGIVSRSDVLAVFSRPDDDIWHEITSDVIADGFFMDPAQFTVTVTDGIVTLQSPADTAVVSHGIAQQARHIEGVVAVRERFSQPQT